LWGFTRTTAIKIEKIDIVTGHIIKTYNCINEAYEELNKIPNSGIGYACSGKKNSAYGFKWEFTE
jgi:hypothetical protein